MATRMLLFGPPSVVQDGVTTALPRERGSQLLVLLAHRRGWVARHELAALLWPEHESRLALTNLRKALFRLQERPWGAALEVLPGTVKLDADTDVAAFDAALQAGHLADALALRRGEWLHGFDDDANEPWTAWLRFERDRLRAAWRAAALDYLAEGGTDTAEGIDLASRLLQADPLDEAALRALMERLAHSGQTARARQAYRDFTARMTEELGLAPGAQLQALHDDLGSAGVAPAAPQPAPGLAGFIGRTGERRRIAELLARDDVRLVCLTGPGGMGKTRLARCVLHDLAAAHGNDAAFVPLEDLLSMQDVATHIARELGLVLQGRVSPLDQLSAALRERATLLVLDNFEQLVDEAQQLDALLAACPRIKLLVTSRVRLGLAGEQLYPLEGLPCPEPEDADRLEAFDAARLFIAAARRVEPALVPAIEAAAIVDICRQLDGLPLALELAAAWTRVLPCAAIAAELRAGTELLRADDATHPPRHASMEVVFEQSWQRLVRAERDTLARLSVFRGGFHVEAARAVAAAALPVLSALADKSLLRKDGLRLALHPLVQQLAAHKLGETQHRATRAAHAAYFQHRLIQCRAAADTGERTALRAIDVDLENFRLAWQWALDAGPTETLPGCAAALLSYFDLRGLIEDGLRWMREAVDAPRVRDDVALHALLESRVSHLCYRLDRYTEAESLATHALERATRDEHAKLDDRASAARTQALIVLAACALRVGRLGEAQRRYEQLLARVRNEGRPQPIAGTLDNLALVHKRLGHYDEALRLSLESLEQHRRIGHGAGIALCLNNLGALYMSRDEPAAAQGPLREALALCERDGLGITFSLVQANLSQAAMQLGDLGAARRHAQRGSEGAQANGNRGVWAWMQSHSARVSVREGDLAQARAALAEGLSTAVALGAPSLLAPGLLAFAELLDAQGHHALARRCLAFFSELSDLPQSDRDEMRALLARWGGLPRGATAWPGMALPELLQRIVNEAPQLHAPLIALLETPR
ncbi:BTAD domain-containing putative transcriptional regulator [Piscinibacter sp.]|uniref:BTAD domain-containing putative transcriptional regulator n=1 Tax=Piscinibacter sp. TaxID=1903157 RepID=UPI002B7853A8|nr:BTAD domain-containing putative transcriptional regulator [Albitalea sp.]HUG24466.1 BTAD domain-containing putative transcriptional regulator [Albitalea sp.]